MDLRISLVMFVVGRVHLLLVRSGALFGIALIIFGVVRCVLRFDLWTDPANNGKLFAILGMQIISISAPVVTLSCCLTLVAASRLYWLSSSFSIHCLVLAAKEVIASDSASTIQRTA